MTEDYLRRRGARFTRRNFFQDRFTRDELADVLRAAGLTPRDVLSRRSRAYREQGLSERELDDDQLLDMMVSEPTLLRRPIVVTERGTVVGIDKAGLDALLENEH